MDDIERSLARQWLRTMRGDQSQADLVADITATTGWSITRDRYSKYESGSPLQPMGREVFGRFVDYWTAKGRPAPDLTPPAPQLSLEERAVVAAERQADAIAELLAGMAARLDAAERRSDALEALVRMLLPDAPEAPATIGEIQRTGHVALDDMQSRPRGAGRLGATGR